MTITDNQLDTGTGNCRNRGYYHNYASRMHVSPIFLYYVLAPYIEMLEKRADRLFLGHSKYCGQMLSNPRRDVIMIKKDPICLSNNILFGSHY